MAYFGIVDILIKEGTMSVGDQLLMVNDKSLLGCTYEQVSNFADVRCS